MGKWVLYLMDTMLTLVANIDVYFSGREKSKAVICSFLTIIKRKCELMTVHRGGALAVEYFESYLELIMRSRQFSLEEAKSYTEKEFFKQNLLLYGEHTYTSFSSAYENLKGNKK